MANIVQNPVSDNTDLWEAFRKGDFYRLENIASGAEFSRQSLDATYRGFIKGLVAEGVDYRPSTSRILYFSAEWASSHGLEKEARYLYAGIIKGHRKAGRQEAAARVRMVAGLTKDQRENYIGKRLEGEIVPRALEEGQS